MSIKPKSDYAIVLSCNPAYGFGLISTLNAQEYFGTRADWEIAYEDYTEDSRKLISDSFSFNINWTPINELMLSVNDKRSDRSCPLNRFWLSYWLLAKKLIEEKKYKAICVIQADQFVFVNLNDYFARAEREKIMFSSHYNFSHITADKAPYGDDKNIWDRSQCSFFDSVNIFSVDSKHSLIPKQTIEFQSEDAFRGEANHSVIALNRAILKYGTKDDIIGLPGNLWCCDAEWGNGYYKLDGDKIYHWNGNQVCSWHSRWWQIGRVESELIRMRNTIESGLANDSVVAGWDIQIYNYNLVKSFMERFNARKTEIMSTMYQQGNFMRPLRDGE